MSEVEKATISFEASIRPFVAFGVTPTPKEPVIISTSPPSRKVT